MTAQLTVVSPVVKPSGPLPITGINSAYLLGALVLILGGSTLVLTSRRRRRHRAI
jgi:LPXTG-motif cell wall-anchored protein